ncbi:hypothetical protein [Sporosarcina cyprini]|uniref:hypothetical protein n=1 Tax=Sporosarcina cyprini TaxID=2910523 RepID=UPI001EDEBD22|nr:hypothetical protein [Sporosarcina cyprini]MCG3089305.1 hypothetical protein [Sporosarcina cyprini]
MKKIFVIVMIISILAGCSRLSNTFNQAQGKVTVDNKEFTMVIGDFEWKERNIEARKINSTDLNDLADEFKTLQVQTDDKIKIEIENNPSSIIINQWNEDKTSNVVELVDNKITPPSKKGYYIYEVIVKWDNGKATYVFDIDIK